MGRLIVLWLLAGVSLGCGDSSSVPSCGADLAHDPQHCGGCAISCAPGQVCNEGVCAAPDAGGCQGGFIECSSQCVDAQSDPSNCGVCGRVCLSTEVCSNGVCRFQCSAPFILCGTTCLDPRQDDNNCGSCGTICTAPTSCAGGSCTCPGNLAICANRCTDTQSDVNHCGGCNAPCAPGASCIAGACVAGASVWPTLGADVHHSGFNPNETGTPPLSLAWSVSLRTMYMLWPVVSDGARVYVTERSYQDPQTTLWALSSADGSVLWSHDFGSLWQVSQPTVDNGHVYVAQVNNNPGTVMYSFVARDGSLLWSQPIADQWDEIWAPLAAGDDVYIESGEYGGMYGFDTADGAQLFYIGLGQYDQWSPLYLNNGIWTYVAGNLEKHDPLTGALRFMATVPWTWVDWSMHTSPISDGTKIYAIAPPNLHAFMPGQTTPVWTTSGSYSSMPAIANGVVYTISGGQMRANDAATGTTLWTFPADGVLNHPPALAGHWAFVASDDHVYAVDTNTHAGVWMGAPGGWLSIADGKLYVAQPNGTLSAWALTP